MASLSCCGWGDTSVTDFEKVYSSTANGIIPVTKYVSKSSGLTVFNAEIEGPIVSAYICVATRALDDNGLPHTLEHLIFLGSENYPYSGVLDKLATKCQTSGINAWTDVDHTCFTLNTAGSDGFCQILPIFMDHILYPLLTDAAYKTEVYHVGGRGNDAGVIYAELLTMEGSSYSKATDALFKELYPAHSGYHWNVGGTLENLRESCSNELVRKFHKKFYHPRNICVVICGKVDLKRVFSSLYTVLSRKKADKKGVDSKPDPETVKPWLLDEQMVIPDVSAAVQKTVQYPSTDEESGCLATVGFLGPSVISADLMETFALIILFKYLSKGATAPLQQTFIERETGFLASTLDFNVLEYSRTAFLFEFEGVAVEDKEKIVPQLRQALKSQEKSFDMTRMTDVIKASIQTELGLVENSPHSTVAEASIKDFLYGNNDPIKFDGRLNRIGALTAFLQKPESFWLEVLREKILSVNWVTIFAEPSRLFLQSLASQENSRVWQRKELLGVSGLSACMHELDNAILLKSLPIPEKILKKVKLSSMSTIQYHKINRIKNPTWVTPADFPATLCLDDIQTNFIYVGLLMDTSKLEDQFRVFLPLFNEVLLTSSILRNPDKTPSKHELIPLEEVTAVRDKDLQSVDLEFGLEADYRGEGGSRFSCGSYSHILSFGINMEMDKVEEGMSWIRKTFWETRMTMDRIKIAINTMVGEIYLMKCDGRRVCQAILKHLIYRENSNVVNCSFLSQFNLLQELGGGDDEGLEKMEESVRIAFEAILKVITEPTNISLHIATNVQKLTGKLEQLPCGSLGNLLKTCFPFQDCTETELRSDFANYPDTNWMVPLLQTEDSNPRKNQLIYGLRNLDALSYLAMIGPGPSSYLDSDVPALLTTLQYFTQQGGPLFRIINASGNSCEYNVVTRINEGLIYFHLSKCVDIVTAYFLCLAVFTDHGKSSPWSEDLLVSAKSSLIFDCLETERTPLSLAANSCLDYFRNVPGTFIRDLIMKIAKVSMKEVKKMTKKYLDNLFYGTRENYATVVVCPDEITELVQRGLEARGKPMRILPSLDELF